jgi:hypothetical protein
MITNIELADVEIGNVEALAATCPEAADDLHPFQKARGD